jgi:hypothetical protein
MKSLSGYAANVKAIKDPMLQGRVANYGDNLAEVSVYLSRENEVVHPEADLIAHAFLAPGETAQGFEMMTENGGDLIKSAFKLMIDGKSVAYDYVVVSETPLKVKSTNLRIQVKLDVTADIF